MRLHAVSIFIVANQDMDRGQLMLQDRVRKLRAIITDIYRQAQLKNPVKPSSGADCVLSSYLQHVTDTHGLQSSLNAILTMYDVAVVEKLSFEQQADVLAQIELLAALKQTCKPSDAND